MSDLLSADFSRLMKSYAFLAAAAFCIEFPVFEILIAYYNTQEKEILFVADNYLNSSFIVFGLVTAVFISLFIGTEYNEGTIRNKLIMGQSRVHIYLSKFIVCNVANLILQCVFFAAVVITCRIVSGQPLIMLFQTSFKYMISMQLIGFYIIAAYSAVFVFLTMMISSMAVSAVVSLMIAAVLMSAGYMIGEKLSIGVIDPTLPTEQLQMIEEMSRGADITDELRRNVLLFLDDFLPSCQAVHLSNGYVPGRAEYYIMYDLAVILVFTVTGTICYSKKEFN